MKRRTPIISNCPRKRRKTSLQDLDSDGTLVELAEAMIAVDPSKATKEAADKMLQRSRREVRLTQEDSIESNMKTPFVVGLYWTHWA